MKKTDFYKVPAIIRLDSAAKAGGNNKLLPLVVQKEQEKHHKEDVENLSNDIGRYTERLSENKCQKPLLIESKKDE